MDGLILVNKPQNITSHDVVIAIRKILKTQKVGHYGTLDPLATGLVVVAVGKATRLFPFYSKKDKVYTGRIRLGFSTDTYDSSGKSTSKESLDFPSRETLLNTMKKFEGKIRQVAPPYSAKKYKGKPLYALVRGNKEFELKPCQVNILSFELNEYNPPYLEFNVGCSSGTYIRSLAHDLGQALSCGAHLSELQRTEVGDFRIEQSFSLEKINILMKDGKTEDFLIPIELLLPEFPKIILEERGAVLARNGNIVPEANIKKIIHPKPLVNHSQREEVMVFRMFSLEGKFLALAKRASEKNHFHPFLVIDTPD
jgi:tRNA pseudouridine55 synthase